MASWGPVEPNCYLWEGTLEQLDLCADKIWFLSLQPVGLSVKICYCSCLDVVAMYCQTFSCPPTLPFVIWLWGWLSVITRALGGVVGYDSFGPKGGHFGANRYTGSQLYCQVAFGKTFRPYPPRFLLRGSQR